ncbi:MAG: dTMP kinase [Gammaproteobacteria bacterium]|nr:dTMP kinase [Gammaproteobacteria bacterium]MDP2141160.1 dTMP kinase [Gammaproteobacteria bacterium]MDP2349166.1 dTMP kinase [Gammaproteobacteria bacterium]
MIRSNGARFITVEGVEGVGKTTNIRFITQCLHTAGVSYVLTREPGGTVVAESIRQLLLAKQDENLCELTELLLVFAARAQHIKRVIEPALANGKWVICDRFTDATYAYQGGGRGLSMNTIAQLENLVQGDLRPDVTYILDLPPAIGLKRANQRGELDRFEQEKLEFFDKVRAVYLERAAQEPERCIIIDAQAALATVQYNIGKHLKGLL